MKTTQGLHDAGQSLWLDNITQSMLTGGTLRRYVEEFSITGLTSNPTIFDHAIGSSDDCDALRDRLGIAVAKRAYAAYRELLDSDEWLRLANAGARPQRLLCASTATKDPEASDVLYIAALAAPYTVNTMPEATLLAFAHHGEFGTMLPRDGGDAEVVLRQFARAGIDADGLADTLQQEGADAFVQSWNDLLACLKEKSGAVARVG